MHVTKAVAKLRRKGPQKLEAGKTKTPDAVRTNPLHPLAVRALRAWKAGGWVRLVGRHPKPTDLVFPRPDGKLRRPRDADHFRSDLETAGCATKYGAEDITYTDGTRHSFATWLGAAGVPDELIGRLLGHAARSVTRRHYVGDDLARLQEAVEKIVLDVSMGQVLTLPLAAAGRGAPQADHRYKLTAERTAGLTAGRGKRGPRRRPNLLKFIGIGGVAEWSKAPVLKQDGEERPSLPPSAIAENVQESEAVESAHRCNASAVPVGRGKQDGGAAVSVRCAIDLLDAGQLDGARSVLVCLLAGL